MISSRRLRVRLAINRSQALVLMFFAAALTGFIWIRVAAPDVYAQSLNVAHDMKAPLDWFVAGVIVLVIIASVAVVARWRWMFWITVLAMVAGSLRLPAGMLELTGVVPSRSPAWYVIVQMVAGLTQFAIGLALIRGYRKRGPWGSF